MFSNLRRHFVFRLVYQQERDIPTLTPTPYTDTGNVSWGTLRRFDNDNNIDNDTFRSSKFTVVTTNYAVAIRNKTDETTRTKPHWNTPSFPTKSNSLYKTASSLPHKRTVHTKQNRRVDTELSTRNKTDKTTLTTLSRTDNDAND